MDIKPVVKRAKEYIRATFDDENISNVGLEEVVFDPTKRH